MTGAEIAAELDSIIGLLNELIEKEVGKYVALYGKPALSAADVAKDPEMHKLVDIRDRLLALHTKLNEAA